MNKNDSSENCLFENGAKLIILGLPEGAEFGIDLQGWTIGNRFKGLKMIPPGFHFYYISIQNKHGDMAPRTNYCHYFHEKETLVKKYDTLEEGLGSTETSSNLKENFKEIEAGLGCYPFECWSKWISLSHHISYHELSKLVPENENVFEHGNSDYLQEMDTSNNCSLGNKIVNKKNSDIKIDIYSANSLTKLNSPESENKFSSLLRTGMEINFSKFPVKPYKIGATPSEISKGSLDSSYTMSVLLQQLNSPTELLSEVQFSFISFLVGQDWDSWEHWKKLIIAFCNAEETLIENSNLYFEFLSALHYQIHEVPEDLFTDIVESKNFLVASLRTLFANVFDNKLLLPSRLISKAQKFQEHLISKFRWNLELEEEGEDLPVIIEI